MAGRPNVRTLNRSLGVLAVLAALAAVALAAVALHRVGDAERDYAVATRKQSVHALKEAANIAAARKQTIETSCSENNDRHEQAIKVLDREIAIGEAREPQLRAQLEQSQQFAALLIEALAPLENCAERTEKETTP